MTLFISSAFAQELEPDPAPAPAPVDATHAEVVHDDAGHTGAFPPFDPSTFASQLLWLALSFGLLYWVISRIAAPRIASILEVRRDRVAGDLGEAERLRGETDAAVAAYEQSLADARKKAGAIAAETRAAVNRDLDAKRHAIETDLAAKVTEAEARIAEIKTTALAEVDAIATETTEAIVSALIGQSSRDDAVSAVASVRQG
jgi:F-type H+-transporting ATPase subunit b